MYKSRATLTSIIYKRIKKAENINVYILNFGKEGPDENQYHDQTAHVYSDPKKLNFCKLNEANMSSIET